MIQAAFLTNQEQRVPQPAVAGATVRNDAPHPGWGGGSAGLGDFSGDEDAYPQEVLVEL